MVSCRHVICHQCEDENARAYRELLVDVARKIDQLGCDFVDLPKLVEEALKAKYEHGFDVASQP